MRHLRARVLSGLDAVKVFDIAMVARRYVRTTHLPIVTYHRLGVPERDAKDLDEGVVDASEERFARDVELMARRFTLCGTDDLVRHFRGEKPLPKNAAMITFDDGYRACHDVALPILQRFGAKATFFLSTWHLGERRTFFWDRVSYIVKRSTKARATMEYPSHAVYELAKDRTTVLDEVLGVVKRTFALDVERYLRELATAFDVEWTDAIDRRIADDVLMTWDQARALRRAGMDIGSHTHTHRVLGTLPPDELRDELERSKRVLEAELDEPVASIAYPIAYGTKDRRVLYEAVRRAGYALGFAGSGGESPLATERNAFDIRRFGVEPHLPRATFHAALAMPALLR